jgi:hypothetical protein
VFVVVGTVRRYENPFAGLGYVLWYVRVADCLRDWYLDGQPSQAWRFGDVLMICFTQQA